MMSKAMRRHLTIAGLLLGTLAFAACGSGGPGVQARQTGDTTESTTTTTAEPTTTTAPPATGAPETSAPAPTSPSAPPCTDDALESAYTAQFGALDGASLQVQKCVGGWATSSQAKGFDPPSHALYRAEGDHWVALNKGGGKLCTGHGVPAEVAPQIGCET
jgi:hypothetical protein